MKLTILINRPREDERLSRPCWLTYSGRFTHTNGYHQLQVWCRPVKVCRSETDVLPLSHPTNKGCSDGGMSLDPLPNTTMSITHNFRNLCTTNVCVLVVYLFTCPHNCLPVGWGWRSAGEPVLDWLWLVPVRPQSAAVDRRTLSYPTWTRRRLALTNYARSTHATERGSTENAGQDIDGQPISQDRTISFHLASAVNSSQWIASSPALCKDCSPPTRWPYYFWFAAGHTHRQRSDEDLCMLAIDRTMKDKLQGRALTKKNTQLE